MKLSTNFATKNQLNASSSELNIDVDLMTVLPQLSILSPTFFGGVRVQFVVEAGETVGSSPGLIGPGNRISETFHKSQRGSLWSASNEVQLEDGNGTTLLEALGVKGKGIGDIGGLNLVELKEIFRKCFTSGISTFNNKEALVDLFERLHEFKIPQQVPCDNLFVGRGSHASAGVKVPPDLVVYDTPCQLFPHIERQQPGLLENKGILPRLSLSASEVPLQENQTDAKAPGAAAGSDVVMQPLGRVCLPKLAHLRGHNLSSTLHISTSGTAMTEVIHPRSNLDDVYALKDASSPSCYPQSQLDVHELLFEAGSFKAGSRQGKAGELSFLAATRSVSALHVEGCRILSLFEIIVFTYRWYLQIANDGYKCVLLTPEGWRVLEINSPAGSRTQAYPVRIRFPILHGQRLPWIRRSLLSSMSSMLPAFWRRF